MKKVVIVTLASVALLLTYGVSVGLAQDSAEQPVEVVVEGVNYCLLCDLAKDDVAAANSTYALLNALRVTAALDKDNNIIADLEGKTLHYLPTKEAEPLLVGEQNKDANVTVTGLYYKNAAAIKVVSFESEAGGGWEDVPTGKKSNLQVL